MHCRCKIIKTVLLLHIFLKVTVGRLQLQMQLPVMRQKNTPEKYLCSCTHQNCEHSTGLRTRTGSNSLLNRTDRQCVCTVSYGKPEGTFIFKVHDLLCFRASIIWKTGYYSVKICCLDAYSFCSDCIYTFLWNVFILRTFMFLVINCD